MLDRDAKVFVDRIEVGHRHAVLNFHAKFVLADAYLLHASRPLMPTLAIAPSISERSVLKRNCGGIKGWLWCDQDVAEVGQPYSVFLSGRNLSESSFEAGVAGVVK